MSAIKRPLDKTTNISWNSGRMMSVHLGANLGRLDENLLSIQTANKTESTKKGSVFVP